MFSLDQVAIAFALGVALATAVFFFVIGWLKDEVREKRAIIGEQDETIRQLKGGR